MNLITKTAAAIILTAGAAQAVTTDTTINFNVSTGSWTTAGVTYGAATVLGGTIAAGGKILTNNEKTRSWSGSAGGLGICTKSHCSTSTSEDSNTDQHTIDGKNGYEMALIDFGNLLVELTSVTFAYWDSSDEFEFGIYDTFAVNSLATSFSTDLGAGNNVSTFTYNFGANVQGSKFGFGTDYSDDEFKLKSLTYSIVPTSEVPLPAAGILLIAGLGGLGALRKKRKAA